MVQIAHLMSLKLKNMQKFITRRDRALATIVLSVNPSLLRGGSRGSSLGSDEPPF